MLSTRCRLVPAYADTGARTHTHTHTHTLESKNIASDRWRKSKERLTVTDVGATHPTGRDKQSQIGAWSGMQCPRLVSTFLLQCTARKHISRVLMPFSEVVHLAP